MRMGDMKQYGFNKSGVSLASLISHLRNEEAIEAGALRAVVRGQEPVARLMAAGIEARAAETANDNPNPAAIRVSAADLAEGIMNLKDNPAALSDWASFILMTSELYELEDEHCDYWDRLLSCIWDLAFGADIGDPAVTLACAVRRPRRRA